MNLVKKLRPSTLPSFDYTALGDTDLEQRARAAVDRIRDLQKAAVVDIGRELLGMKELLPHGQFLPWVESFGLERRTATNYMQVAAEFGGKWETVAHLPTGILYKLASPSTPASVRDAVMQIRPDQVISKGNVQELIDTAKAGEARKDRNERREQIQQARDAHRAKWEKRDAKERAHREEQREQARKLAQQAHAVLGAHDPELCGRMRTVDVFIFSEELSKLLSASEAS